MARNEAPADSGSAVPPSHRFYSALQWLGHSLRRFLPAPTSSRRLTDPIIGDTIILWNISFDPAKPARTLAERGLDFADAGLVFAGVTSTDPDTRHDYGEDRYITAGYLHGRRVVLVWTPRDNARRIISMRYAHADEEKRWTD